ncbi:MAG: response regulator [Rhizorhabdus sp.]
MHERLSILIVEDEAVIALGLAFAAEDAGAEVVGPFDSIADALALLANTCVDAAILDVNLRDRDITPVALALIERAVPFVVQTGTGLPVELAEACRHIPVMNKPASPDAVVSRLLEAIREVAAGSVQ